MKQLAVVVAVVAFAVPAVGQDYTYGRIRHVEGGTTLQRATEPSSEEAFRNLPFVPGDRIWTDESGRAEFQFGGGAIVRLDERSKLDYLANEDERGRVRVTLRLWSGALLLRNRDGRGAPDFDIETPGGLAETRGEAVLRIDIAYGETVLSAFEGGASFDDGRRRVRLEAGEQIAARRGEEVEAPRRLGRAADEFARWDEDRERQMGWRSAEDEERYLPEEVAPYATDLRNHGSWHLDVDVGYVWQPHVASTWRPYTNGRWVWSAYGWTWAPNEIWGWAPSHYGRWGHSVGLGWYWMPDRRWGPAWVSWAHGSDYIGWCPLGRGDRPVTRGSQAPWTYARREDLPARDLSRRRVEIPDGQAQGIRVVERGHIDRSLRVVEGERAAPRNVQTRPTPGDTIPELRSDPMTTIPFPVVRRRYASEDERREREGRDRARTRIEQPATAEAPSPTPSDNQTRRRDAEGEARTPDRSREVFSAIERRRATERSGDAAAAPETKRERATDSDRTNAKEREAAGQVDREVLRRVFRPLSGASERERREGESTSRESGSRDSGSRDSGERARPHTRETPRESPAPPRVEKRESQPRNEGDSGAAVRRKKDKER